MKKTRKLTATQRNINKINANILSIAKTFGTNSAAYQNTVVKLHTTMQFDKNGKPMYLDTYDKNGVIQIRNTAENRRNMHQSIRKIANSRKSVNVLKRHYKPIDHPKKQGDKPKGHSDFDSWYEELSAEFSDLVDEIYNYLEPSCDMVGIALDVPTAFKDDVYRFEKWREVFGALISDLQAYKKWYDKFKVGIDVETGENMTRTNDDYKPRYGVDGVDPVRENTDIDIDYD